MGGERHEFFIKILVVIRQVSFEIAKSVYLHLICLRYSILIHYSNPQNIGIVVYFISPTGVHLS